MTENLAYNLIVTADQHPGRPALRFRDSALTYAELDALTARLAGRLTDRGLLPGDRVGIMLPNVPEFAIAYYGVLRAGGVIVPMNVLLKEREASFYLGDSAARQVICWKDYSRAALIAADEVGAECLVLSPGSLTELLAEIEPLDVVVDRDGSDTAVILYTSGT